MVDSSLPTARIWHQQRDASSQDNVRQAASLSSAKRESPICISAYEALLTVCAPVIGRDLLRKLMFFVVWCVVHFQFDSSYEVTAAVDHPDAVTCSLPRLRHVCLFSLNALWNDSAAVGRTTGHFLFPASTGGVHSSVRWHQDIPSSLSLQLISSACCCFPACSANALEDAVEKTRGQPALHAIVGLCLELAER